MKLAMTGANGNVGRYLAQEGVVPLDCNVTDIESVRGAIMEVRPSAVAHLASKSNVNWCQELANQDVALNVNLRGTANVMTVCEQLGINVVFISSDHIFSGRQGNYKESEPERHYKPVNFYGLMKLATEGFVSDYPNAKIVRSSVLFDHQRVLIKQFLDPMKGNIVVEVPDFQTRNFMHLAHFSKSLVAYMNRFDEMPPVLNIAGAPEPISWWEFVSCMRDVYGMGGLNVSARHRELPEYNGAPRPKNAGLNISLSQSLELPQWHYKQGLYLMQEMDK